MGQGHNRKGHSQTLSSQYKLAHNRLRALMISRMNTGEELAAPQGFEPRYADPESMYRFVRTRYGHGKGAESPMKLSQRAVLAPPPPVDGNRIQYDEEIPGFGARITSNGVVSFIL